MRFNINNPTGSFRTKRQTFGVGSLLFLFMFGLVFIGVSVLAYNTFQIDPSWHKTPGTVIDSSQGRSDGSTYYRPIVEYEVSNRKFTVVGNMSSSSRPVIGSRQEVAYSPANPMQSKLVEDAGSTWFLFIFPVVGVVMLLLGPILFMRSRRRNSTVEKLLQGGHKLQGVLVDIQSQQNRNSSSYKIVVSATNQAGVVQNYVSDSLAGIGGLAMADFRNNPIPIDVFVDPLKPNDYYVDVDDIPNLTPERIGELIKSALDKKQGGIVTQATDPAAAPPNTPSPPSNLQ